MIRLFFLLRYWKLLLLWEINGWIKILLRTLDQGNLINSQLAICWECILCLKPCWRSLFSWGCYSWNFDKGSTSKLYYQSPVCPPLLDCNFLSNHCCQTGQSKLLFRNNFSSMPQGWENAPGSGGGINLGHLYIYSGNIWAVIIVT